MMADQKFSLTSREIWPSYAVQCIRNNCTLNFNWVVMYVILKWVSDFVHQIQNRPLATTMMAHRDI